MAKCPLEAGDRVRGTGMGLPGHREKVLKRQQRARKPSQGALRCHAI